MKLKELKGLGKNERMKKLKDLKLELVKSKTNTSKTGNSKAKEIRKIIARILTLNNSKDEVIEK
jgi:ribosomal protein L29